MTSAATPGVLAGPDPDPGTRAHRDLLDTLLSTPTA